MGQGDAQRVEIVRVDGFKIERRVSVHVGRALSFGGEARQIPAAVAGKGLGVDRCRASDQRLRLQAPDELVEKERVALAIGEA